jgi:hypothetical protein
VCAQLRVAEANPAFEAALERVWPGNHVAASDRSASS